MRWGPLLTGGAALLGGSFLLLRRGYAPVAWVGGGTPETSTSTAVPFAPRPEAEVARPWKVSPTLRAKLRSMESFVPNLYDDPVGHCTVGVGHLVHLNPCDGRVSEQPYLLGLSVGAGETLFDQDIAIHERWVSRNVHVPLAQSQFDALVSFAFNVGIRARKKVTEPLNRGDYAGAATALAAGPTGGGLAGLITRRREEANLFRGGSVA